MTTFHVSIHEPQDDTPAAAAGRIPSPRQHFGEFVMYYLLTKFGLPSLRDAYLYSIVDAVARYFAVSTEAKAICVNYKEEIAAAREAVKKVMNSGDKPDRKEKDDKESSDNDAKAPARSVFATFKTKGTKSSMKKQRNGGNYPIIVKEKNISLSASNINFIVNRSNGDRKVLTSELEKIELYSKKGKKVTLEVLRNITNLIENHSINELIDNSLIKNKNKTIKILNENNFNNDDTILIIRTFLSKCKRILELSNEFDKNNNVDLTISSAKPPIFWKDKEIIKTQIKNWSVKATKNLIFETNQLELLVKKNSQNSLNILMDFIFKKTEPNN